MEKKKQKKKNILEIVSARDFDDKVFDKIRNKFGKNFEVKKRVDQEILGGVIIKTNSFVFDGSIRSKLNELHSVLSA